MESHCSDHEAKSNCLVKLKTVVDNLVREHKEKLARAQTETDQIWSMVKDKLDSRAFYWVMGTTLSTMAIVLSFQWTLLFKIDEKVDKITVNQAVMAQELKIDLE